AVPRVDDHGFGGRVEGTGPDELAQGRDGDAAGGLAEDALGAGEQPDALDHLLVGDVLDGAVRAADDVQDVRAVGGVADGEGLGDRVGLHRPDDVVPGLERGGDGGAAGGLRAEDAVRPVLHETQGDQLLERLVDLGEL